MGRWSRRKFLATGVAVSASALVAKGEPLVLPQASPSSQPAQAGSASQVSERLLLDRNWRFHLGHACDPAQDFGFGAPSGGSMFAKTAEGVPAAELKFDDSAWRAVNLPHDWAVELPFVNAPDLPDHGGKPLGRAFPATSIGWYRRSLDLPADTGKRYSVQFDGVFRDAMVFWNGIYVGRNLSGYAPFGFDVTDFVQPGGRNLLALRVDATEGEGWFYEGAGIYRHVWLRVTGPLHLVPGSTVVRAELRGQDAILTIENEVANDSDQELPCHMVSNLIAPDGLSGLGGATEAIRIGPRQSHAFSSRVPVSKAQLWSLEQPNLYGVECRVESDGQVMDEESLKFGIRTLRFDADKGFFLNGKPVKIKGTCNHQDHAGVGSALPDRLQYYRIERLKEMGCNAYRTSHNPPTPELLDACDRLGMLVLDETRMMSSSPEGLSQLERMVRRDRNHPSVILWSLGNEEPEQGRPTGEAMVASMKRLVRRLDPTRMVTMAMNGGWGKGVSHVVDVQGFNYYYTGGGAVLGKNIDQFHRDFPQQPCIGTETASEYMTRGIYEKDEQKGYVSAYDVNFPNYTSSAEDWWRVYDERPFLSGGFAWTGFDYRGEPSPYQWPCISSHFGALDTCGFPKDTAYFYKAAWSDEPVLHLFPHWNWESGKEVDVWCYSNLERVELLLNGRSLGAQPMPRNGHVAWKVDFAPGVLEARAYRGGQLVLSDKRETTGSPARIHLRPDRSSIRGDGEDVVVVAVEISDAQDHVVPTADNPVQFAVSGPGRILGVGNGDPSSHEPDKADRRRAFNGLCCVIVQSLPQPGEIGIEASSDGLQGASTKVAAAEAPPRPFIS